MSYFFRAAKIELIRTVLTRSFQRSVNKGSSNVNTTLTAKQALKHETITPMRAWKHRVNNEDRLIQDLANEGRSESIDTTTRMKSPFE